MRILVALLMLIICSASVLAEEQGYGYLYQYDVEMNTDMEWDVAPEALEVGTARGGAGAWVAPLTELGNWDDISDEHQTEMDEQIQNHNQLKQFNDEAARQDLLNGAVLHNTSSIQFTNAINFVSVMAGPHSEDFVLPGGIREEGVSPYFNETFKFSVPVEKLAEYLPVTMRTGWPSDPVVIDFSDGWKLTFYNIVKICYSFVHCVTALGVGIKMIRWAIS